MIFYKTELVRLRNWVFSKVFQIQRIYRAHHARLRVRKIRDSKIKSKLLEEYKEHSRNKKLEETRKYSAAIVKNQYAREREIEFTAWATGRLANCDMKSEYKGKRMKAYSDSCYSDDKFDAALTTHLAIEKEYQRHIDAGISEENRRKQYINSKVTEVGPKHYGYRTMKPDEVKADKKQILDYALKAQQAEMECLKESIEQEALARVNEVELLGKLLLIYYRE